MLHACRRRHTQVVHRAGRRTVQQDVTWVSPGDGPRPVPGDGGSQPGAGPGSPAGQGSISEDRQEGRLACTSPGSGGPRSDGRDGRQDGRA